jgi:hypothetical protein
MLALQIIMPSEGDMSLLKQEGGVILLQPVFYGGECAGPHVRVVDVEMIDGKANGIKKISDRYRLRFKSDGKVEIKRGVTDTEENV